MSEQRSVSRGEVVAWLRQNVQDCEEAFGGDYGVGRGWMHEALDILEAPIPEDVEREIQCLEWWDKPHSHLPANLLIRIRLSADLLRSQAAEIADKDKRLRETAQILIEEVGADGPCNAEDAARRTVAEILDLKALLRDLEWIGKPGRIGYWCSVCGEGINATNGHAHDCKLKARLSDARD